jgi:hypothetical protein
VTDEEYAQYLTAITTTRDEEGLALVLTDLLKLDPQDPDVISLHTHIERRRQSFGEIPE